MLYGDPWSEARTEPLPRLLPDFTDVTGEYPTVILPVIPPGSQVSPGDWGSGVNSDPDHQQAVLAAQQKFMDQFTDNSIAPLVPEELHSPLRLPRVVREAVARRQTTLAARRQPPLAPRPADADDPLLRSMHATPPMVTQPGGIIAQQPIIPEVPQPPPLPEEIVRERRIRKNRKELEPYSAKKEEERQRNLKLHIAYGAAGSSILAPVLAGIGHAIAHDKVAIENVQVPVPAIMAAAVLFGAGWKVESDISGWREARAEAKKNDSGERRIGRFGRTSSKE